MTKGSLPTVLIVDDEPGIREVLMSLLGELACLTAQAADGLSALQLVKAGHIDVVVSDLRMPNLSGVDFLEMARMYGFSGPFILITGYGAKSTAINALQRGAFDFIEKPFDLATVKDSVNSALEVANSIRALPPEVRTTINGSANIVSKRLKQAIAAVNAPPQKKPGRNAG